MNLAAGEDSGKLRSSVSAQPLTGPLDVAYFAPRTQEAQHVPVWKHNQPLTNVVHGYGNFDFLGVVARSRPERLCTANKPELLELVTAQ
jgi:hypothetical protein